MDKYTIKVLKPEDWQPILDNLQYTSDGNNHVPRRAVECIDDMLHSPTRGTFELTKKEAEELKKNDRVQWIELSRLHHLDQYPKPIPYAKRFKSDVKIYRDIGIANDPPATSPGIEELNRTNWAVKRVGIQTNGEFWSGSTGNIAAKLGDTSYSLTGKNVDIIIQDSGILQYHPEFMYGGQSRVRDVILDGPLYIDPDSTYLNNNKYTKNDGRIGITTAAVNNWWENNSTTYRSARFASGGADDFGTITIAASYTAPNALGVELDGSNTINGGHGSACAGLAAGKNFGTAIDADLWNISIFGNADMNTELTYDAIKVFHKYKKVNPVTARQNPTIVNGSWGYFAGFNSNTTVSYKFRGTTGNFTGYNANSTGAQACAYGLDQGNNYNRQFSTSSRSDSVDTAGNEMVDAGVIFITSAGNNNQYLTNTKDDPHRLDYFTTLNSGDTRTGNWPSGTCPSAGKEWIHPQHVGYNSTTDYYPAITVGCLDEYVGPNDHGAAYSERKVSYSNNGPGIDIWSPGDETLSAGTNSASGYTDYQRWDDGRFYDCYFNGTSAAAPIVTGVIALYLEIKPDATSQDVREWIRDYGSVSMGSTSLLNDEYPYDPTYTDGGHEDYWRKSYNLRGADPKIIYDPYSNDVKPSIKGVKVSGISFSQT